MNKAMKDTQAAGDQHDEETTGIGGQYATVVESNPKCMGCLHYAHNRAHCTVALFPASCGDGSSPETSYAPLVPNEDAYQEWRAKRGLQHNAPRSTVVAAVPEEGAEFVVQVLGDEGHMQLSEKAGNLMKAKSDPECMKCGSLMKGSTCSKCRYKSLRHTVAFDSKKQAERVGGPVSKGGGKISWSAIQAASKRTGSGMPGHKYKGSAMEKLRGDAKPKTKKTKKSDPWAIIDAAYAKLSDVKKAQYDRHNFMVRLIKKGGRSLVEEFGHGLAGYLFKARHEVRKAAAVALAPKTPAGHSPVLAAVRRKQMANPTPAANLKASQAGGGKVFGHAKLAEHLGVKPEGIAEMAHGSSHSHEFVQKIRKQGGDKVKNLTDGQLRSAYHSTGLMHSMTKKSLANFTTSDLDLIKAHKAGKRHVIGHTTSGKPVHSDGHEAESLHGEEHNEACELHGDIGGKLSRVASQYGSMSGDGKLNHAARKYVQGLADHHNKLADRHRATHYKHTSEQNKLSNMAVGISSAEPFGKSEDFEKALRWAVGSTSTDHHVARGTRGQYHVHPAKGMGYQAYHMGHGGDLGVHPTMSAAKAACHRHNARVKKSDGKKPVGVSLSNSPSDADIAKAMMAGGGAGSLVKGGMVSSPLNVGARESLRQTMDLGLQASGEKVEVKDAPIAKEPEPKFAQTVGGVLSAAWDLGNYRG